MLTAASSTSYSSTHSSAPVVVPMYEHCARRVGASALSSQNAYSASANSASNSACVEGSPSIVRVRSRRFESARGAARSGRCEGVTRRLEPNERGGLCSRASS